jgi:predicted glycosyltransferase
MPLPADEATRVLLYSHDSQGLGHVRRNLALAHALAQQLPRLTGRPVTGLLLTGVSGPAHDLPEGFDVVHLPGVSKGHGGYRPRRVSVPMADLLEVRGRMLAAVIGGFRPDLVVVDRHAYGVDGELREGLRRLRQERPGAKVVLGLREVLDAPEVAAREWARLGHPLELRTVLDAVWVYGDPVVHDPRATGEIPVGLQDLVAFTGYLSAGRRWVPHEEPHPAPYLLTMVGGGSDGADLCRAAVQAPVPPGFRHVVVTGPQMPDAQRREIAATAGPQTQVVDSVPDGQASIRGASAIVAMAGYNTTCEIMNTSAPALLVPREVPRREQLIRATALAARGAVEVCRHTDLDPQALGRWFTGAVTRRQPRTGIDLQGLRTVAHLAAELLPVPAATHQEVSVVAG